MISIALALALLVSGGCMTARDDRADGPDEFTRVVTLSTPNSTVSENEQISLSLENEVLTLEQFETFDLLFSAHTIRMEIRFKSVPGRKAAEAPVREIVDRLCDEYPGLRPLEGPEADAAAESFAGR